MSEWRTMDSAPKDGSDILVTGPYIDTHVAWWCGWGGGVWDPKRKIDSDYTHWKPVPPKPSIEEMEAYRDRDVPND